jgi:hypothetical protein
MPGLFLSIFNPFAIQLGSNPSNFADLSKMRGLFAYFGAFMVAGIDALCP